VEALREAGHTVRLLSLNTDQESRKKFYKLESAWKTISGHGKFPLDEIESFKPDVVHVHNLFPNIGTDWIDEVQIPIVTTLHNFRPLCANGLLFRDGAKCLDCPDGRPFSAVVHKCYHDSRLASIPLTIRNAKGIHQNKLLNNAAAIICLSRMAADLFTQYGVDSTKVVVVQNGIAAPKTRRAPMHNGKWAAVGRLTPEKGFTELSLAWPEGLGLDIIGDGPENTRPSTLLPGVRQLPSMPRDQLLSELSSYTGLVFPSLCQEMQPTIILEAMALGIPVVARAGSAGAELVQTHKCGSIYSSDEFLARALQDAAANRSHYGDAGLEAFEHSFQQGSWVERLENVYKAVLDGGFK